jgi:hypothetical protein
MGGQRWRVLALSAWIATGCTDTKDPDSASAASGGGASGGTRPAGSGGGGAGMPAPDASSAGRDAASGGRGVVVGNPDAGGGDASPDTPTGDAAADSGGDAAVDAGTPSSAAVYGAHFWAGGLNHVMIWKFEDGYCVNVDFSWPSSNSNAQLELPDRWSLTGISAMQAARAEDCQMPGDTAITVPAIPEAIRGRVAFRDPAPSPGIPCSLDLDLHVRLIATQNIPAMDRLTASDVQVDCGL